MVELLVIALGGAAGALARHGMAALANAWFGTSFPWGTFIVNVTGSLLIGIAFVILIERAQLPPLWRPAVIVGFLGAFTTFSTYSLQALALLQEARLLAAGGYILGSVVVCIAATGAGMALARLLP